LNPARSDSALNVTIACRAVLAALAIGVLACADKGSSADDTTHVMNFDTSSARLVTKRDTLHLSLELARNEAQRTMGLMERRHLNENAGMLFLYDSTQPPTAGYWMYRTRIPLDIAFMDSTGVVRAILGMVPCTATLIEGCPSYPPNVPYHYALEMNAGYFARHQVNVGDALLIHDVPAR
jgi:uncharacterized membrane protein (UPF0127 family)